jgi:putative tryptophan/tyrosine transport system substrate-binding protein
VRRREFITLLSGAAAAPLVLPRPTRAQQSDRMRRIGVLMGQAETDPEGQARFGALRDSLQKLGWISGRNLQIDHRWLGGDFSRLSSYVPELITRAPDVIFANGTPSLATLQRATSSIPIVFAQASDPVGGGFVASAMRPGGNITGFTDYEYAFAAKWLELLKELAPGVVRIAVVHDDANILADRFFPHIETAGSARGVLVSRIGIRDIDQLGRDIDRFADMPDGGLIVLAGTLTLLNRDRIIAAAARHRLPSVYPYRVFAQSGGLTSYGVDVLEMYRGAASYVDRILKGERPASLPVQFATKFEFVINLKAAKAIGLTMPTSVLLRASEVIE